MKRHFQALNRPAAHVNHAPVAIKSIATGGSIMSMPTGAGSRKSPVRSAIDPCITTGFHRCRQARGAAPWPDGPTPQSPWRAPFYRPAWHRPRSGPVAAWPAGTARRRSCPARRDLSRRAPSPPHRPRSLSGCLSLMADSERGFDTLAYPVLRYRRVSPNGCDARQFGRGRLRGQSPNSPSLWLALRVLRFASQRNCDLTPKTKMPATRRRCKASTGSA